MLNKKFSLVKLFFFKRIRSLKHLINYYHISCIVNDGNGTSDGDFIKILVVQGGALIEGIVKNAVTGLVEEGVEVSLNGLKVLSNDEGFYSLYVPNFLNSCGVLKPT